MNFAKHKIRCIDSLAFFLCRLSDLSDTYSIDTKKGYFPHKFNIPENQNYVGPMPDIEMYGPKNMYPTECKVFVKWYRSVKNETFDFKQ